MEFSSQEIIGGVYSGFSTVNVIFIVIVYLYGIKKSFIFA